MANTDNPRGLEPIKHLNGNAYNGQGQVCYIPDTDGNDYFIGQPVDLSGDADSTGKFPGVSSISYGNGNPIFGIIVGFDVGRHASPLDYNYGKASTKRYPIVANDPDLICRAQISSGTTPSTGDIGGSANLSSGTGDTTYGTSGDTVDGTTLANNTSGDQVHVLRVEPRNDNELAEYADVLVTINNHRLRSNTGV